MATTNALQHLLAKVEPINKMAKLAKALMWNFIQTMQFDYIHMRSRETLQVQTGPIDSIKPYYNTGTAPCDGSNKLNRMR